MSKLSISEAATVLGKSERQIRYLIKKNELRARKVGGRWKIESEDLPLNERQRQALARRVDAARSAFERGVSPADRATESGDRKRRYSVNDLDAFTIGVELYRETCKSCGSNGSAEKHLLTCLEELTAGCHSYHPRDKAAHFSTSRREATAALVHLLIAGDNGKQEPAGPLADRLEQKLIPKVSSLIASQERRRRR